ncbi:MAG: phosphatidylglycerophosphatase A [Acidobacteriota bacterium]|nr:MAG: phosphatidylglycerophosphatase A [Acidobacteriota bacterium]
MKQAVEKRKAEGYFDHLSLALTTWGVGCIPGAPGTYGSLVGVGIFLVVRDLILVLGLIDIKALPEIVSPWATVMVCLGMLVLTLAGVWAAGRSTELLGNSDPSQAVVDEVIGQLIVFLFVPFMIGWQFILAGFMLFRLFDIWKPYPIRQLEVLPGGLGICADDMLAGVYAGICLAVIYPVSLSFF